MIGGLNATPVGFVTKDVDYRLGESVMIPLEASAPVAENTALELKALKPGVVEISRQPEILKDQQMGFARIRTLTPGEVVLKCGEAMDPIHGNINELQDIVMKLKYSIT